MIGIYDLTGSVSSFGSPLPRLVLVPGDTRCCPVEYLDRDERSQLFDGGCLGNNFDFDGTVSEYPPGTEVVVEDTDTDTGETCWWYSRIATDVGQRVPRRELRSMNHSPEPSEHLGLIVPTPDGLITGRTFSHSIPEELRDTLADAAPGESYTYRGDDGLEWTATVDNHYITFKNTWATGERTFRVRRDML